MNYLLDTNIWLERMLDQERAAEVAELLARIPSDQLCLTDFTLHSLGVILHRLKQPQAFVQFVQDVLLDGATRLLMLPPDAMAELVTAIEQHNLDFDDAYQYITAQRYDLVIISLDSDFDRTDRGRRSPDEIMRQIESERTDD